MGSGEAVVLQLLEIALILRGQRVDLMDDAIHDRPPPGPQRARDSRVAQSLTRNASGGGKCIVLRGRLQILWASGEGEQWSRHFSENLGPLSSIFPLPRPKHFLSA